MDKSGLASYHIGDCATFYADVYRYVKTGNGKLIDYSLRNMRGIKKIASFELPSDDDLIKQAINQIICETCFLYEQCNKVSCMRNSKESKILQEKCLKQLRKKRLTIRLLWKRWRNCHKKFAGIENEKKDCEGQSFFHEELYLTKYWIKIMLNLFLQYGVLFKYYVGKNDNVWYNV